MANLEEMKRLLDQSPLVHRFDVDEEYLKIYTDILLGISNDYLNVYLIYEDGEWGLSDANNIYAILDDYYSIDEERLIAAGKEAGLIYQDYRFLSYSVDENNLIPELEKFAKVVQILIEKK
ncbi:MAG: hypothetical protein J6O18_05760 [Bacilli bacterium]|nr:hypothetical protein [Bacilli bacterium]